MTSLSDFSPEDRDIIASLPYRVGIHVSYADDEDGERDDELEVLAMEGCLKALARHHDGESLTKEISSYILKSKDKWDAWSQGVFNITPLCEDAVKRLQVTANSSEVQDYIKSTLNIATAVAQAYGEFGEEVEEPKGFFGSVMGRIAEAVSSVDDENHPMNVSAAEESAITRIADALKKHCK